MDEKNNVISLKEYKIHKNIMMPKEKLFYLSKTELLSQLIDYYEAVKKDPFSIEIALWGEDLMDVISMRALTRELTELAERHQEEGPLAVFKIEKSSQ